MSCGLSDTRRYCVLMAKPILKLFGASGSPIILVFILDHLHRYPIPRGTPSVGHKVHRGGICNLRLKSPFISEKERDSPMVTIIISVVNPHTNTFIRNRNEPYLPLPSQTQLVLIYRPRRDGRLSKPWCEVPRLRFEPAISRLQIRHSTTQPLA